MIEKLQKDYKWLFSKQTKTVVNGKRIYSNKTLTTEIQDHGSLYRVYREKDSSPLILSKNYYEGE